jgi:hypothetical protein
MVKRLPWEIAALVAGALLYAFAIVKDFSGPLIARGDANYFEFLGVHLAQTYRFGFPPSIDFVTNVVGYPGGTSIVYLSWCAERDLLAMLLHRHVGHGPWLQIYAALSPAVSALGVYLILRRDLGRLLATVVAFVGAFMCFYAAFKFPYHLNIVALHWGAMSIAVDYLLMRRVFYKERIELRLLFARAALTVAVIGLDIAYVAGYPLVTTTITALTIIAALNFFGPGRGYVLQDALPRGVAQEIRTHKTAFAFWTALFAIGLVVYVPFAFAVVKASFIYSFGGAGGNFWASQFRMLLPFFPGANPASGWALRLFGDGDGVAEFSVGWALLGLGVLGIAAAKRKRTLPLILPLLVTFALCLAFHPKRFPTLHVFPWFFYNRVAGRATIYFPLWIALIGVEWLRDARLRNALALAVVGAVEMATAYFLVHDYRPAPYTPAIDSYLAAVRAAPGEALLEWPFCISGSNGVGTSELCPYYRFLSTSYSYRRFHDKKVIGFYNSRVHPSQLVGRIQYRALFSPDVADPHRANRETSCFDESRWQLFDELLHSGDFGAIQLDTDFLPPECVPEFHRRYGPATAQAVLPGPGKVELLVRTAR